MGDKPNPIGNLKNQYLAVIAVNVISFVHGICNGWVSPALPILASIDTPLRTGPLSTEQISWISSISPLSAILGTFLFGLVDMLVGSKRATLVLTIPATTFFILIYIGDTYHHILIARFFAGLTMGGVMNTVILFTSEIANNEIRGCLGTFGQLTKNLGILFSFILGAVLSYEILPYIYLSFPIIFAIWFSILPNTPQYYLKREQFKKAEDSLKYYKGLDGEKTQKTNEFNAEFERLKSIAREHKVDDRISWKDIFNRRAFVGIFNGIILASLIHFTGCFVLITYCVTIFQMVGVTYINPHVSSIAVAIVRIVGNLCTSRFSDSLGRKILVIISLIGSAIGLILFSTYSYLKQNGCDLTAFEWIPVLTLSLVTFIASAGIVPLYSICTVECLPSKIRTVGLTIVNVFSSIGAFCSLKVFPILSEEFGIHQLFFASAIVCIIGAIYVYFILEETKGKALDVLHSNDQNAIESGQHNK